MEIIDVFLVISTQGIEDQNERYTLFHSTAQPVVRPSIMSHG